MIKRTTVAILLLVLNLNLVSCSYVNNSLGVSSISEDRLPLMNTNAHKDSNKREQSYISYKIKKQCYSLNSDKLKCIIYYPEISELGDKEKQNNINCTLKDEALKVLKYYEDGYYSVDLNVDYSIALQNASILSIQYSGLGEGINAAHPNNLFFTTNIDMKKGNKLRLKDIINLDENFANKFLNGDFKALWIEQSEALKHYSSKRILEYFKEADSLDNIGTEKQSDVYSYFTADSLGISISVSHSIGDHAEFEIKYKNLKDNIKTESEVWKDFLI